MEQMREILESIHHHEEMHFRPRNDSPEAVKEFQSIAKRIVAAHERGYLVSTHFLRSNMEETRGFILDIMVNGGLTFEGEQFLSNPPKQDLAPALRGAEAGEDIIEIKPNVAGIGVNLNEAYRRLKRWWNKT
jgi:hypothetical protein